MPLGVFKITDIPEDKVGEVMSLYALDAPKKVEKAKQANGLFTVIATFSGPGESTTSYS
jgi:hypothetical protein